MRKHLQIHNALSHGTLSVPWLTLTVSMVTAIIFFLGHGLFQAWVFDHDLICQGQVWRLLSGHFVHCTFEHLFWDIVGLIILGAVIEVHDRRQVMPALLMSCAGVSLWLLSDQAPFARYCGLSGALNGLLVVAVVLHYRETKNRIYLLAIVLTVIKMIFEFTTHQTIFTDLAAQSMPGAHAAGFISGLCYIAGWRWLNTFSRTPAVDHTTRSVV